MAYITNVIKQSEGDTIFINDSCKLKELILNGNTVQDGTPAPTSPIAVETVTGRQVVSVSNGTNTQNYEINLGKNIADIYLGGMQKGYTETINGVTFTINDDGTISGSGTATAQSNFIFYGSWSGNGLNIPIDRNSYYHFSSNGTKDSQSRDNGYFYVRVAKINSNGTLSYATVNNNSSFTGYDYINLIMLTVGQGVTVDFNNKWCQIEKGNQATPFVEYKTPIELCKIGDYKDKIYKENGKWYLYKTIGKVVLNGSENITKTTDTTASVFVYQNNSLNIGSASIGGGNAKGYSNYFRYRFANSDGCYYSTNFARIIMCMDTSYTVETFKTWLGTHNTEFYYVLATPTTTEITDTELINQLESVRLLEGLNNVLITSSNLSSPIKLEYYSTENPYVDAIYSQQEKNDLKIWFDDVELEDAGRYCESITRTARILPDNGEKRFCLDTFYSTNLTVILHNVDLSIIKDQVRIEIGTDLGNNEYKYIPLGIFNIQDSPEINKNKITLKLRDNRVKFEFNYDAQPLIESLGGTATKKQILNDICEQAGVVNTINSFANEDDEVALYDNTIEAQTYVSYLMEQAGLIPTINRYGQLIKIDLSDLYVWRIPLSLLEGWEKGEPYKIERVVYESGIIKYETDSDENLDTLYINSANPYIFSVAQVEGILNKLKDFEIDSVLTKRVLGNPAIDPYDIIEVYNDLDGTNDIVFRTLANTTYKFNGVHRDTFETQIGKESRTENVTKNSTNDNFKRIFTNINQLEGKIELNATETAKNTALINSQGEQIDSLGTIVTQSVENITASVTSIQEELSNGVSLVKTTTVTVNDEGLTVATDNSKTTTIMTSDKFAVRSGGKDLAFFGYDDEIGSTKAEMDNLTVTNYFVAGYHRTEKYDVGLEHRTGVFYIGE